MPLAPSDAFKDELYQEQLLECCGCIVAVVEDKNVELQCNECGAVVGVIQIDILYVVQGDLNGWPRGKARRGFTGRRLR